MNDTRRHVQAVTPGPEPDNQRKMVPADVEVRERVRAEAGRTVAELSRERPLTRAELEDLGRDVLESLDLDSCYLGFTMVAISNRFWREQFASVAHERRLLLLPHCLRKPAQCQGTYDAVGLNCAECGACPIAGLKAEAESLGYEVVVAEGTPAVVQFLLDGRCDAILGVACLDSLEKAFERVVAMGVPHAALPLLAAGCVETTAELDVVRRWMHERSASAPARTRTYAPLLRAAHALFDDGTLEDLLAPCLTVGAGADVFSQLRPTEASDAIAADWLREGGKRFRPFITVASYAAMTLGASALEAEADLTDAFPVAVKRVAVAIEVLHKASLVHDDIEDDDPFRYGRETLHRRHGLPVAVNVGDHLVGVGYRLIALGKEEFGGDCIADILALLSEAHVKLCRGQGTELFLRKQNRLGLDPGDVQTVYALKTAPAFEVAMYAGLRLACSSLHADPAHVHAQTRNIRAFSRYLGVAYQVLNDLDDWQDDGRNKVVAGQDSLAERPTMLRALAFQSADDAGRRELLGSASVEQDSDQGLERLRVLYERLGVFERAERLVERYRERASAEADRTEPEALRELMHFILRTVL